MPGTLWIPSSLAAFVCLPPVNFESDICTCPQKLKSAKAMDPNQRYQRAMKVLAASAKVGSTNLRRTAVRFGRSRSIMRVVPGYPQNQRMFGPELLDREKFPQLPCTSAAFKTNVLHSALS